MPRFIVVGHRAVTTPQFSLDDLAGAAGRMDLLLNAANAALLVSHDLRRDSEATLILLGPPDPPRAIRLHGTRLRSLSPAPPTHPPSGPPPPAPEPRPPHDRGACPPGPRPRVPRGARDVPWRARRPP